ncbi:SUKH-4 family immunity protein, partial [Nocardia sp. NPDC058497]|uniref:SUKH-4 family immunity protein n=1 Tax=Nocardia sp. NPDC058497 TaxID=3346529 RepID=UPI0036483E22
ARVLEGLGAAATALYMHSGQFLSKQVFAVAVGRVVLLGLEGTLELVNSSLAAFVEFLYRFALFIDADRGLSVRVERARELRQDLTTQDPRAFVDPDSWWNVVVGSLST